MSQAVLQLSAVEQQKIIDYYTHAKIERNAPGVIFAAKLPTVSITAYKSGKILFQGTSAVTEAAKWGETASSAKKAVQTKGDVLPPNFEQYSVIGSDETGTGDFFGPMTVAAVYVDHTKIELLKELGIKDSKMLTDDKMVAIADDIKAICPHSILILRNEKYNEVQEKGWSQGKIKALLHNKALSHVLKKMAPKKPEYILIDQFAERGIYYNHIKNEKEIIRENVYFSTKAEQVHIAVAAASILARVAFVKEMDQLSAKYHLTIPKGASNKVDEVAARILMKHGEDTLKSITKWHFANANKAKALVAKKRK